jgi:hypothetical protein
VSHWARLNKVKLFLQLADCIVSMAMNADPYTATLDAGIGEILSKDTVGKRLLRGVIWSMSTLLGMLTFFFMVTWLETPEKSSCAVSLV